MEFGSKQHHHDRVTRGTTHQHGHKPPYHPLYPQITPTHNHVEVRTPSRGYNSYRHNHHHHNHSYSSTGRGGRILFVGFFILLPIVVIAAILSSTLGAMSLTTASLTAAGAGAAGAMAFSASIFGIGALVLYGALGLAYLYSSAKECYSTDKNVFDMIKSRVVNEDGLSFKGIMKSVGSVLWSPFLLMGGLSGMAIKAAVNVCASTRSESPTEVSIEMKESYKGMGEYGLGSQPSKSSQREDELPVHTDLYHKTREGSEKEHHLLDSQVSFPLYPTLISSN
ncbi:hypothetical protein [Legionella tucsonensis]|uniref:Transmembrane protein n=1 Tax=Legionella tucsonensis TaxID=40335 RepID=A0A0W0ZY44_9GAMM|nr:hypothetical protein [Legionella tucsonensis]KTD74014.1 transmembrane protein [Legionella tucsonensis]